MILRHIWIWLVLSFYVINPHSIQAEISHKGIINSTIHQQNQFLCAQVVKEFCQTCSYSSQQLALTINSHLDVIARELFNRGLDLTAYSYDQCDDAPYLKFARIPLWEGARDIKSEIPLTLFIYVWPPEHLARQIVIDNPAAPNDPRVNYYATHIHGHPLPCAFTILKGTLYQENYVAVTGYPFNVAKKIEEETLKAGMSAVDDNSSPFVHRVVCQDKGLEPAMSLHGYGASTAKEVLNTFIASKEHYFYPYILQENGELVYQNR